MTTTIGPADAKRDFRELSKSFFRQSLTTAFIGIAVAAAVYHSGQESVREMNFHRAAKMREARDLLVKASDDLKGIGVLCEDLAEKMPYGNDVEPDFMQKMRDQETFGDHRTRFQGYAMVSESYTDIGLSQLHMQYKPANANPLSLAKQAIDYGAGYEGVSNEMHSWPICTPNGANARIATIIDRAIAHADSLSLEYLCDAEPKHADCTAMLWRANEGNYETSE